MGTDLSRTTNVTTVTRFPQPVDFIRLNGAIGEDLKRSKLAPENIAPDVHPCRPMGNNSAHFYPIPYYDLRGQKTGFSRYRYLEGNWAPGLAGERYYQKKGTGARLYVPIGAHELVQDQTKPLWITEGEKKAASLFVNHGVAAVGIAGVWSGVKSAATQGRRGTKARELIGELSLLVQPDREIVLCFDADYALKGSVQEAQRALCQLLYWQHLCSPVGVVYPHTPVAAEDPNGVDDWIAAGYDVTRFEREPLIPPVHSELHENWVWVGDADAAYNRKDGRRYGLAQLNRAYAGQMPDAGVTPAYAWHASAQKQQVRDCVFEPSLAPDAIIVLAESPFLNLWRGPDYPAGNGTAHAPFIKWLTARLAHEPGALEYTLSFFAHLRQNPGDRIRHHLHLWSAHEQTGKSFSMKTLWRAALGAETAGYSAQPKMVYKVDRAHMDSDFCYWAAPETLLVVSEDNEGFSQFRRRIHDTITSGIASDHRKGKDPKEVQIKASFISTGNQDPTNWLSGDSLRDVVIHWPEELADADRTQIAAWDGDDDLYRDLAGFLTRYGLHPNFKASANPYFHGAEHAELVASAGTTAEVEYLKEYFANGRAVGKSDLNRDMHERFKLRRPERFYRSAGVETRVVKVGGDGHKLAAIPGPQWVAADWRTALEKNGKPLY